MDPRVRRRRRQHNAQNHPQNDIVHTRNAKRELSDAAAE